ncbi:MAG: UDP-N-acetylmuramoyl-tripeptide--D-alanyl-D-alanine ligase [Bdellovibrio sp.]
MRIFRRLDLDRFFQQKTKGPEAFRGFSTDSRKLEPDSLFFALRGETHDAHNFLQQAFDAGARAFVVEKWDPKVPSEGCVVYRVPDTLKALQNLANFERNKFQGPEVGITGSNGKTTTKEFLAAILEPFRRLHYSRESFNNHFGVPFTLLSQPEEAQVVICEMGMNHRHEIEKLCAINRPTHVVCTMVGTAHIESLGSPEGIAQAKEEIYSAAPDESVRVYNLDNPWTAQMVHRAHPRSARVIRFSGQDSGAEVFLRVREMDFDQIWIEGSILGVEGSQKIPVFGTQNLTNIQAAVSLALGIGLSPFEIWSSLSRCRSLWGRNQRIQTEAGFEILFDGYNSNPESMKALLDNFSKLRGVRRGAAVFAEMLEMGSWADTFHEQVGRWVGESDLKAVYFFGPHADSFAKGYVASGRGLENRNSLVVSQSYEESLARSVFAVLEAKDLLLVKGSRGMKLEKVVQAAGAKNFSLDKSTPVRAS